MPHALQRPWCFVTGGTRLLSLASQTRQNLASLMPCVSLSLGVTSTSSLDLFGFFSANFTLDLGSVGRLFDPLPRNVYFPHSPQLPRGNRRPGVLFSWGDPLLLPPCALFWVWQWPFLSKRAQESQLGVGGG